MKGRRFFQLAALTACVLLLGACPQESKPEEADPGVTWERSDNKVRFVLYANGSFSSDISKMLGTSAIVTGKLAKSDPGLKEKEYTMEEMDTDNTSIKSSVASFNGTKVILTYSADGKQFEFDSPNETVKSFFGGTFNRSG
ncbi:MAG: hypothetical protein LBD37_09215 [Treponema sp.]|jgi:hypothetical protein|nr:hypothetical protein [Treponema sp.]